MKLNDTPIQFKIEPNGNGSIVSGTLSYEVTSETYEPILACSEQARHIMEAIKCTIDNKMSEYVRQNPVNDGYTTIRIEEYADYMQLKMRWAAYKGGGY